MTPLRLLTCLYLIISFPHLKYNIDHKKCPRKPWMTNGLLRCCLKKKLYKLSKTNPIAVNESKFKKYRYKLNKLIRITEKEYYTSKFESYTCNYKENVASN